MKLRHIHLDERVLSSAAHQMSVTSCSDGNVLSSVRLAQVAVETLEYS